MGINYRCIQHRKCGARRTLRHPIDWYKFRPKCLACKKDTLKPISKEYERGVRRKCVCRGNGWIHVPGRIIDANRTCIHADWEDVQTFEMTDAVGGGSIQKMKPDDDCPF